MCNDHHYAPPSSRNIEDGFNIFILVSNVPPKYPERNVYISELSIYFNFYYYFFYFLNYFIFNLFYFIIYFYFLGSRT